MSQVESHFVIIGDVSGPRTYHVGDEAMLESNLLALRDRIPTATFAIVSRDPDWTSVHYDSESMFPIGFPSRSSGSEVDCQRLLAEVEENAVRWRTSRQAGHVGRAAILQLSRSRALVISGGGNLCSTWPEHVWERVALMRIAATLEKPVVVIGQTLGPDLTSLERELLAATLSQALVIGLREYQSVGLALSLGIQRHRILYQLDDAIFLPGEPISPAEIGADLGAEAWIAVTVAPFADPIRDPQQLRGLACELARISEATKMRLVFVPHVAAPPEQELQSDVSFARALTKYLDVALQPLVLDVFRARQVKWLTSQASLVISSRYHPVVFGLESAVPVFGIYTDVYTQVKITGALAHAGLQRCSMPLQECSGGKLSDAVLGIWHDRERNQARLRAMRIHWKVQEEARWRRILAELESYPAAVGRDAIKSPESKRGPELPIEGPAAELGSNGVASDWSTEVLVLQHESLVSAQSLIHKQNRELASLKPLLAAREEELTSVKQELAERDRELGSMNQVLAAREEELASVKYVLAERDRELASIKQVLAARDEELASVKYVLAEHDRELASIKPVLAARDEELASVKHVLAERQRELGSIKPVLAAREEELTSVKQVLAERDRKLGPIKLFWRATRKN